jgi:hypothetical protein
MNKWAFSLFWLELDPRNLLTLCIRPDCEHHVLLGHLDDYESYNPKVLRFVQALAGKSNRQIRADAAWQQAHAAKPKHFDDLTPAEQSAFKKKLDRKFRPIPAIVARAARARAKINPCSLSSMALAPPTLPTGFMYCD